MVRSMQVSIDQFFEIARCVADEIWARIHVNCRAYKYDSALVMEHSRRRDSRNDFESLDSSVMMSIAGIYFVCVASTFIPLIG